MRASCPKDSALVRLFMGETPARETDKLLGHLASCAKCSFRFGVLRQVKRDLQPRVDAFADSSGPRDGVSDLQGAARQRLEEGALRPAGAASGRRSLTPLFGLRLAVGLVAVVAVLSAGAYLAVKRMPGRAEARSPSPQLSLLSPSGTISTVPNRFRWTPVLNAENYRLELIDESLRQVFAISTFIITEVDIPGEVQSRLLKGRAYVWSITAQDGNGTLLSSRSGSFVIK